MTPSSHFIEFFQLHHGHLDTQQRSLSSVRGKTITYRPPTIDFCTSQLLALLLQYPGGVTQAVARTHLNTRYIEQDADEPSSTSAGQPQQLLSLKKFLHHAQRDGRGQSMSTPRPLQAALVGVKTDTTVQAPLVHLPAGPLAHEGPSLLVLCKDPTRVDDPAACIDMYVAMHMIPVLQQLQLPATIYIRASGCIMPPPRPSRPTPPAARRILPPRQLVLCVPTLHDAYTMLHIDPTAPLPHHALTQVVAAGAAIPNRGPPQPWGPVVCGRVVSVGPVQHGADTSHGLRARGMVSRCVMLGDVEGGGAEVALWLYDAQVELGDLCMPGETLLLQSVAIAPAPQSVAIAPASASEATKQAAVHQQAWLELGPSYLVVVVPREPSSTTAGVAAVADGGGAANGNPKMGAYTHPTNNNNKENQPTAEDDVGNGQSQALMTLDTLVEQQPTDKQVMVVARVVDIQVGPGKTRHHGGQQDIVLQLEDARSTMQVTASLHCRGPAGALVQSLWPGHWILLQSATCIQQSTTCILNHNMHTTTSRAPLAHPCAHAAPGPHTALTSDAAHCTGVTAQCAGVTLDWVQGAPGATVVNLSSMPALLTTSHMYAPLVPLSQVATVAATQDMCVCEGVIQQVTGMTRVALHKVCLRATECVSVDLDDDDDMFEGLEPAVKTQGAPAAAVRFWHCGLCNVECGENAVQKAAYAMVLHVGDATSSVTVHVPPSCGGIESLLARCWDAHQREASQVATQVVTDDVDLTEHAHAMQGARLRLSVCCTTGGGCVAARVLLQNSC